MKKYQTYLATAVLVAALGPAMEAKAETEASPTLPIVSNQEVPVGENQTVEGESTPETTVPTTEIQPETSSLMSETGDVAQESNNPTASLELSTESRAVTAKEAKEEPTLSVTSTEEIDELVSEMTVRQKITQMLMPDFRKWQAEGEAAATNLTVVNQEIAEAIDGYDFGGVILFAENVKETEQTFNLTQALQEAAISNKANNGKIPLLIGIDQEGGIVYRLGSGTALPGNMAIGATDSPELARVAGEIIGRELSSLGVNVNFAPVLDTNNNPNNPVIGLRSFSSDPVRVARLGTAMMEGIQGYNVAVAAKHFPGHGDTAVDSHTGLPLVDKNYAQLELLELLPFKVAVDNGVDMLMTAHIQYPQIEKDTVISKETGESIYIPATLSDDILTGIVRNQYGYNGIIITDAMGMDAISKNFGETEAALMAIQAGVDIVLMPTVLRSKTDLIKIDKIIDEIEAAVASGQLDEARLDQSVRRILTLKDKRGILDFSLSDRQVETALAEVGSDLNRDLERVIAASAVTVVKNDDTILPFKVQEGNHVLLLGAYNNELPGLELGMRRLKADGIIPEGVSFETLRYNNQTSVDTIKEKLDAASHIIIISEIGREAQLAPDIWLTKLPTEVVAYANQTNKEAVVMSISKPYDVANYPDAKAIVAVYGNKGMDPTESLRPDNAFGPNITAGVEVIFNGLKHIGRLPVDIPVIEGGVLSEAAIAYPLNHGLFYNDPVKQISVELPASVLKNQKFVANLTYNTLLGLEKQDHLIALIIDRTQFEVLENEAYHIDENYVVFNRKAGEAGTLSVSLKALVDGEHQAIQDIYILDAKNRLFSLEEAALELPTIAVVAHQIVPQANEKEQKIAQSESATQQAQETSNARLPQTGEAYNLVPTLIGFGLAMLGASKLKRKMK